MQPKSHASAPARRRPKQRRARETVEAILDAVTKILKREGSQAITTNRIADVAGVSIGSLYQYFPDKRAIFIALHRRHIEQMDRLVERTLVEHATSSLQDLLRAMVNAMIDTHSGDPEFYQLLMVEVPHRADGSQDFAVRLDGAFRLAIAAKGRSRTENELDKAAFIVANMMDGLCHGAVLRQPAKVSLREAKDEIVRALLAYLRSPEG
jgi:AcrR family transcriptional regulator